MLRSAAAVVAQLGLHALEERFCDQRGVLTGIELVLDQQGRVAWIGSPFSMDRVLEELVAGKYDLDKARSQAAAEQRQQAQDPRRIELLAQRLAGGGLVVQYG